MIQDKCDERLKCPFDIPNHNYGGQLIHDDWLNKKSKPKKPKYQEYKIIGSPDTYAVQYHKTGHIITTAKTEEPDPDIREMDLKGKFNLVRKYPRQLM